ncbi:Hypothetical protein A7982_06724 [Minicystis rosea]|nr:Hypothetical protein A7982_06724 [Minicystis rosea]
MRAARACFVASVAAIAITAALPAHATGSAADRDAARSLAGKGYELFEAGEHERAIELFQQAEARFHAPPHSLYIARAQVKLGKLIAAEATYKRVAEEQLADSAPKPFREAQASARAELAEVRAQTPSMLITIEGDAPPGTRVLVDHHPIDLESLAAPQRQDPGAHLVSAESPGKPAIERTVVLAPDGKSTRVSLSFPRSTTGYVVSASISFGVGAVGIGVGIASTILAINAKDAERERLRIGQITGFALGGAGVVAGAVILAVRPKAAATAAARPLPLRIALGAGSISLSGEF